MSKLRFIPVWLCLGVAVSLSGCGETSDATSYADADINEPGHSHDHGHHHEGPHGGEVLEVDGNHKYHAEVVFDAETRDVSVYILGGDLKTPVPVAAGDIEFEIEEGEDESHLDMTAAPLEGEADGLSSVYKVPGASIPESAKSLEDFHWHMHLTIDENEYNVEMAGHDHGEHGHDAHGHDDDHDHAEGKGHDADHDHGEDHDHKDGDKDHDHKDEDHK